MQLQHRREGVRKPGVGFHLGAFFRRELAVVADVGEVFVDLYETGRLVQHRARSLQFGLHVRQQFADCRKFDDRLAELLAFTGVFQRFAVSGFRQAGRLRADAQTGCVHQRHHVFDQPHLPVADQFGRGVREDQLAGRRTFDTEFILDAAHLYGHVVAVVNEHRQSARVGRSLFRTGQHQRDVSVAVGDEPFHAVQQPSPFRFVPVGLQHYGLQVAAGVGLGQVHRAGFAPRYARQVFRFDLFRSKLVQRFGAVLQTPDVFESGVGAGYHFVRHHEVDQRKVQSFVLARQRQAEQTGFVQRLDVSGRSRGIDHMVVHHLRAVVVDAFGIRGDHVAADLADDLHHAAVAVLRVLEIGRRIIV